MPTLASTLLAVALAGALALAASVDPALVAVVIVVTQLVIATGPGATDERGRRVASPRLVAVASGGVVAVLVSLFPEVLDGDASAGAVEALDSGVLAGVALGMAVALFVALVGQMLRSAPRAHLVLSLGYAVMLSMFAVIAAAWVGASDVADDVVAVAAAALAAAIVAWRVPGPRWVAALGAVLVAAGAAAGAASLLDASDDLAVLTVMGLAVGATALLGDLVARALTATVAHAGTRWGFAAALPVALAGPVVFVASQLLI